MKTSIKYAGIVIGTMAVFAAGMGFSKLDHHSSGSAGHIGHEFAGANGMPKQGGQGAFSAISEIVNLLEADPDTDWSKVNITRLRDHLVDMNSLTLGAEVTENKIPNGMEFVVTGHDKILRAIQAMVPAHAMELNKMARWSAETEKLPNGVRLKMTSDDATVIAKISALGFFGLMASGSHHQPHHLAMATGKMMHNGH